MSSGWYIFLFLLILGVVTGGIGELGIWDTHFTNNQYSMSKSTIEGAVEPVNSVQPTIIAPYQWMMSFFKIIGAGLLAVVSIAAVFWAFGFTSDPVTLFVLAVLQMPEYLIVFVWLFEVVTGRSVG